MQEKILFVDDEPQILAAFKFSLGSRFNLFTAESASEALRILTEQGPFAVIVSDLEMPKTSGGDFLETVRKSFPDCVRLMLTSRADLQAAIKVVNQANIFRFLTKPCSADELAKSLQDALQQYRLIMAERDTLERTLAGSIRMMTDILAVVDPPTFDRAIALRDTVRTFGAFLQLDNLWQLEIATLLAHVGSVTLPSEVLRKPRHGIPLSLAEQQMLARLPEIGRNLLINIPRLESVAQIIYYQAKCFDGSGFPEDGLAAENIPAGARILKIISDLADLKWAGVGLRKAFQVLREKESWYDPVFLEKAIACFQDQMEPEQPVAAKVSKPVRIDELRLGSILRGPVETLDGTLLISAGREVTETILARIRNFAQSAGIKEPVLVESE